MKFKLFASVCVVAGLAFGLAGCGDDNAPKSGDAKTLTVGASPVPHADILNLIAPQLQKEGITLKVIEFSDYIQPNLSLNDKELDANFFQHKPYLDSFSKDRGLKLTSLVAVHIEPMGVYSHKVKNVADVAEGSEVAIPNDPTNGGRALKVLETAGLIKVRPEAGVTATINDVVDNPKKIKFREIGPPTLAPLTTSCSPSSTPTTPWAPVSTREGHPCHRKQGFALCQHRGHPPLYSRAEIQKLGVLRRPPKSRSSSKPNKGAVVPAF
ncbi:MAG: MetQ/NlpA family ABC transporter substrate-binding protein [Sutterella wadsworthensis]